MLDDVIHELSDNFGYVCNKIDKDKFKLTINNDIQVNITKIEDAVYFHSPIIKCPDEKKEQIYTHVMKANLLGQGTGQGTIGIDKDEKFKIYKMDDDTYISYREDSKFHTSIIEIHLPEMEKNLLFKFEKEIRNVH